MIVINQGGTGTVTKFFANEAIEKGVKIMVNSPVENILFKDNKVPINKHRSLELKSMEKQ
jgi:phytoene dehydrogenase-like protein